MKRAGATASAGAFARRPPTLTFMILGLFCVVALSLVTTQKTLIEQRDVRPLPPPVLGGEALTTRPLAFEHIEYDHTQVQSEPEYVKNAWKALKAGYQNPLAPTVVPVLIIPLFHDAAELRDLLSHLDAPVRAIEFIWNSMSPEMDATLEPLRHIPFGITIHHNTENGGFSNAINTGMRHAVATVRDPPPNWFFAVNADAGFPPGHMGRFASIVNQEHLYDTHSMLYGPRVAHFAFAITRKCIETIGYMDETFYPAYFEDIDYQWRAGLAKLPRRVLNVQIEHKESTNVRKNASVTGKYKAQIARTAGGFEYGWAKWGPFSSDAILDDVPPASKLGWRTPFGIPGAPLSLWKVDPVHRMCVKEGPEHGIVVSDSPVCWYNGTVLLEELPPGTALPYHLTHPGPSLRPSWWGKFWQSCRLAWRAIMIALFGE